MSLWPARADAQLALDGLVRSSASPSEVAPVRWPDVALDPEHEVFLAVFGAARVGGLRIDADGAPIGEPFVVDQGPSFAQAPRVTYAPGTGFVVAWHASVGGQTRIRARIVREDGSFATSDLDVSPLGTNWEMGAALAWSSATDEALVVWQSVPARQIVAQRIGATGELRGEPVLIDPRAIYFRDPAVAYDASAELFIVAYAGCVSDGACFVAAQRVDARSGSRVGEPLLLEDALDAGYVPELVYVEHTGRMLAVWYRRSGFAASFHARTFDAEGALSEVVEVTALGSYDANGLAYAPRSGTVLFVTHGADAADVALELDAEGMPLGAPLDFGVADSTGNFNPRVVASERAPRWLAVTSTEYARLTTQTFTTATRDPRLSADAGTVDDAGVLVVEDARISTDAAMPPRGSAGGCGCHAGRGQPASLTSLALLVLVLARLSRRIALVVAEDGHVTLDLVSSTPVSAFGIKPPGGVSPSSCCRSSLSPCSTSHKSGSHASPAPLRHRER